MKAALCVEGTGQAPIRQEVWEQARRPFDNNLRGTGQAPIRQQSSGNRPSAHSTTIFGEQAKRPFDKK
ncbi:MAG: hypothetical protein RBU37_09730 [Myxococcota bacterium]|nr:hypothetical protein [Myxococcota bacterium]